MWKVMLFLLILFAGFWLGKEPKEMRKVENLRSIDPAKEFAVCDHKAFVIILYSHNQAQWCERALRSIFEQDYDSYRVVMIDDASVDKTEEKAKAFILENNQENKVIFLRNQSFLGKVASFYRAIENCLAKEIVIELDAKDWLASPLVLNKLNCTYQNPDVWISQGAALCYPSYQPKKEGLISYYAALFKKIQIEDLFVEGRLIRESKAYHPILLKLSGGRVKKIEEPLCFENLAAYQWITSF